MTDADRILNGDGSGKPLGLLKSIPAAAPEPAQAQNHPLVDSIRVAALAARAKGQGLRHLTLTTRDWKVAEPFMGPGKDKGTAMIGPLLVKHGPNARQSVLWVSANDGRVGNMMAVALLPWFEA